MAFTVGSLFSGIGGIDLGLERAGMSVKWQVEIDDYCNKVLEKHWPDVRRYKDVRTIGDGLEPVDLICGGFPCQPVSIAGRRRGQEDERWLWPEYRRIICQVKPRWIVAENVPGLLSMDSGRLFAGILGDLAESGYDAEWDCIPAAAFGAPHLRQRLFIVAYANAGRQRCIFQQECQPPRITQADTRGNGEISSMAHANGERFTDLQRRSTHEGMDRHGALSQTDWWDVEPDICRVANGVPRRVDRLKGLGNAVVPQVAEWIGRQILSADTEGRA